MLNLEKLLRSGVNTQQPTFSNTPVGLATQLSVSNNMCSGLSGSLLFLHSDFHFLSISLLLTLNRDSSIKNIDQK